MASRGNDLYTRSSQWSPGPVNARCIVGAQIAPNEPWNYHAGSSVYLSAPHLDAPERRPTPERSRRRLETFRSFIGRRPNDNPNRSTAPHPGNEVDSYYAPMRPALFHMTSYGSYSQPTSPTSPNPWHPQPLGTYGRHSMLEQRRLDPPWSPSEPFENASQFRLFVEATSGLIDEPLTSHDAQRAPPHVPMTRSASSLSAYQNRAQRDAARLSAVEPQDLTGDESNPDDDELPDYAQSQLEATAMRRREAARRAAELERRWAMARRGW